MDQCSSVTESGAWRQQQQMDPSSASDSATAFSFAGRQAHSDDASSRLLPAGSPAWPPSAKAPSGDRFIARRSGVVAARDSYVEPASFRTPIRQDDSPYKRMLDRQQHGQTQTQPGSSTHREPHVLRFGSTPTTQKAASTPLSASAEQDSQRVGGRAYRAFAQSPFLCLDAPGLQDNFYLNLVDWSVQNVVVGLHDSVWSWNSQNAKVTKLMSTSGGALPTAVSFSSRGSFLAIGDSSSAIHVYDVAAERSVRQLGGHARRVAVAAWARACLASGSQDRSIVLHDVRTAEGTTHRMRWHRSEVCGLKWAPDGNMLASGGNDSRVGVWDRRRPDAPLHELPHSAGVKALSWSPHISGLLATGGGSADRHIRLWNTASGRCTKAFDTGSQVCNLFFSGNVNEMASSHGFSRNQVGVWAVPTLEKLAVVRGHTQRVCYMAMSPDGETAVTGAGDETLRFWKLFPKAMRPSSSSSLLSWGGSSERARIR